MSTLRILCGWCAIALGLFALPVSGADGLRPFDASSVQAIRATHVGKPFVLAF